MRDQGGVSEQRSAATVVQSVDRALSVLEILAVRQEAGITDIADELGVHKSTAFRLVAALEAKDLVEQLVDRGRYRLGFGVVRLAGAAAAQLDLAQVGRRTCEELAADLGETVDIAVLDGDRAVYITEVRGPAAISSLGWLGRGIPLHATSSGKVLLAHAPGGVREAVLSSELERFTAATVTDQGELEKELGRILDRGWGATAGEYEVGLNSVAAPVRDAEGHVMAALSVSGPSFRMSAEAFEAFAERTVAGTRELGRRLGLRA